MDAFPTSAVDGIVRSLRDDLSTGRLRTGDALPAERHLAAQFGVSRNTVREALRRLAAHGLVEAGKRGTRVADNAVAALSDIVAFRFTMDRTTFQDIRAFRSLIEAGLALDMTRHVTADDLDALDRMNEGVRDGATLDDVGTADFAFHHRLVILSGNATARQVYAALQDPIRRMMTFGKPPDQGKVSFETHADIIHHLRNRDAHLLAATLRLHLTVDRRAAPDASRDGPTGAEGTNP